MVKYVDKNVWVEQVLMPDESTPILGGTPDWDENNMLAGWSNVPAGQLADRTRFLKEKVEGLEQDIETGGSNALQKDNNLSDLQDVGQAKFNLGLNLVDNTRDLDKPVSNLTQDALDEKVDKEAGKGLSSNDFTTIDKARLDSAVLSYPNYATAAAAAAELPDGQDVEAPDAQGKLSRYLVQSGALVFQRLSEDAARTNYMPAGVGAVATTVQEKLRDVVVSVKDFGAVGDGVADDTAAIQQGIDNLAALGGGVLILPSGNTFGITGTLFMKTNVRLIGLGLPKIKAIAEFTGAMIQFGYTTGTIGPLQVPTHPCHGAEINGVEIDGDYKVSTNFYTGGMSSGLIYVWSYCKHNKVICCDIHSADTGLVEVEDNADFFELRSCKIHDMTSYSEATRWQNLVNIDGPENAIIEGNDIYGLNISGYSPPSWGYGVRMHATDACVVRQNRIATGYHNILVDGRKNLIENNNLSGSHQSGIVLAYNEYKCLYNTVLGNYIAATNRSIYEDDKGNIGYVGRNLIIGNTAINSAFDISTRGQGTTVIGNNIYSDAGVTLYPRLTILGVSSNSASSDFVTGSWAPAVDNINNVSGGIASGCRFTRIGNMVHVIGTVEFSVAATGAFELRLPLPVATTFANEFDAAGRHGDTFSVDGSIYALVGGTARLRLVGTASTTGAKTSRFTATYYIQ